MAAGGVILATDPQVWRFQIHPEVWILIVGILLLTLYTLKVVAPNVVPSGEAAYTKKNLYAFWAALISLWFASDWPMHDISEEYLYSVHMVQHMIFSLIVPPLLLIALPKWLARLIVSPSGKVGRWVRQLSRPVAAGLCYNFVIIVTHLPFTVNYSLENGAFHYFVHLLVFVTSLWMWLPVINPMEELRISLPTQMVYLFLMSVIPTVPAGFLTFAGGALYEAYDHQVRLWGIDITTDQQLAGFVMKLVGGVYLWVWIGTRFFQWSKSNQPELVLVDPPLERSKSDH
jgi:putative membrane protein